MDNAADVAVPTTHWEGTQLVIRRPGYAKMRLHESIVEIVRGSDPWPGSPEIHYGLLAVGCAPGTQITELHTGRVWTSDGYLWCLNDDVRGSVTRSEVSGTVEVPRG